MRERWWEIPVVVTSWQDAEAADDMHADQVASGSDSQGPTLVSLAPKAS